MTVSKTASLKDSESDSGSGSELESDSGSDGELESARLKLKIGVTRKHTRDALLPTL